MNTVTADRLTEKYPLGELVAEGKTKKVHGVTGMNNLGIFVSKDDITAGDGAKHDVIPDKGRLANETTCNVFRLLQACGLPVAFVEQDSATSFVGELCQMLLYEVVVRREAHGSYLKRNPHISKGQLFPQLLLEFFLKTSDKNWKGKPLVCDDPLMVWNEVRQEVELFNPAKPIHGQAPFMILSESEVFSFENESKHFPHMGRIAKEVFLILEKAWQVEGRTLVDFKVEFGIDNRGRLLLADVIDNDSWRVVDNGAYIDKQVYRDGGALDDVAEKYRRVAEITGNFRIPCQRIILWRGSESDGIEGFFKDIPDFVQDMISRVICSAHREPVRAVEILNRLVQEFPDSVVIAYIGRSNGAGPTLSATTTVPVITVPANVNDFHEDVWSSLRAPSKAPVVTVLEPANAMLAALNILSARNPRLYAYLRARLETRAVNFIEV